MSELVAPPLSLYIHIPWCVEKCPYCDFNSHALKGGVPEQVYIDHLLQDLQQEANLVGSRTIDTIFIGGGTPSLLSSEALSRLLTGVRQIVNVASDAEITLEANPGTVEANKFSLFQQAGVNRISIGIQSFAGDKLLALGRIHDPQQAMFAVRQAQTSALNSFNIDLMHGLPGQTTQHALNDLEQAIQLTPPHLSWYQLTIEPNTQFASRPPTLPEDDELWQIQQQGHDRLLAAGFEQYEISGYSQPGFQCRHNLNYWRFGDYLGIGCGAHAKITQPHTGKIVRRVKIKHPKGYMGSEGTYLYQQDWVKEDDLPFEYMMNRLRLLEACPIIEYEQFTGLSLAQFNVQEKVEKAVDLGLLSSSSSHWQLTPMGKRYLNSLLELFV